MSRSQDYHNVIKKPMDMSTVKLRLETGLYKDPWEFIEDVGLMFDNAWLYNRKTSKVYKCCSKVCNRTTLLLSRVLRRARFLVTGLHCSSWFYFDDMISGTDATQCLQYYFVKQLIKYD